MIHQAAMRISMSHVSFTPHACAMPNFSSVPRVRPMPYSKKLSRSLWAKGTLATLLMTATFTYATAAEVELLHWWTSDSETKAVQSLRTQLATQGLVLKTPPLNGRAEALNQTLHERIAAGRAPDAVQMKAADLPAWGDENALASLNAVAKEDKWDYKIPPQIAEQVKYKGTYVAVPVNIHRVNWLYINRSLLAQVQGRAPQSWNQFFQLAERLQKAGITPLAQGNQPWQNLTLFETVVLGVGGAEFYRSSLVRAEPASIESPTMARAMQTFVALRPLTVPAKASNPGAGSGAAPSQDWNAATAQVIEGKAAMQIMGDWAKGEFLTAHKVPNEDFLCVSTPGTANSYDYQVDSLAIFRKGKSPEPTPQQVALTRAVISPGFQSTFNVAKGSIPINSSVDMSPFDACAKESSAFFLASRLAKTLVPSVAHRMALDGPSHKILETRVDRLWNDPTYSPAQAQREWAAERRNPSVASAKPTKK